MKTNKPTLTYLDLKTDERGWFAELLRPHHITKKTFGQLSVTTIYPGHIKGNHYHKKQHEWFVAVAGKYNMELVHIQTKEVMMFDHDSQKLSVLYIPPMWNHTLRNLSDIPASVLLYCDVPNNLNDPDLFNI